MKAILLRKARKRVLLINGLGVQGRPTDKRLTVRVLALNGDRMTPKNSRGHIIYMTWGQARQLYRRELIALAIEINKKSKLWHVFH